MLDHRCGQGTDYTGAGLTIPLGHAISARFDVDNGLTNAIVLPFALHFNADAAKPGLQKLAASLGVVRSDREPLTMVIDAIEVLFTELEIPRRLRDVGVAREAFFDIAASSMGDWLLRSNPRPIRDASELQQILEEAW